MEEANVRAAAGVTTAEFQALFERVRTWGRWGLTDQRGALNLLGPERVRGAAGLVRSGTVVSLELEFATGDVVAEAVERIDALEPLEAIKFRNARSEIEIGDEGIGGHTAVAVQKSEDDCAIVTARQLLESNQSLPAITHEITVPCSDARRHRHGSGGAGT
jgi:hypothetical protein